ncbi:MAG: type II toxin-antitoxin system VapB family antitoxin [Acidobacteria bacterium]|nr:type II toxin-antitoxin system VapB family antitoxin [Acidobacteriota bacterium]MBU1339931.1 type II toxin-antitoxin system VapB family antitoxin [Acidobacteriota bacterium]MBU1475224.1 type II toxin-antitoxin system VapB family antitoxin [Acidobacteriota bacterium]MBU2438650.1 type II toxin-antitoxin system VapB family antitoxin [Acidobacteriota bacterium]
MATNLQLDDEMINKAVNLGKHKSKKEAVNQALKTYVQSLEQEKVLSLFGTVEYDPDYDYKKQRNKQ